MAALAKSHSVDPAAPPDAKTLRAVKLNETTLGLALSILEADADREVPGDEAAVGVRYATEILRSIFLKGTMSPETRESQALGVERFLNSRDARRDAEIEAEGEHDRAVQDQEERRSDEAAMENAEDEPDVEPLETSEASEAPERYGEDPIGEAIEQQNERESEY